MLKKLPNAWRCFTFDRNSPLGRFDIEAPYSSTRSSQSVSHLNTAQTQSCSTSLTGWNGCCEMKIILLVKINSICFSILLRLLEYTNQVPTARFSNQHFNRYFFRTSRFQIGSVFSETRPKLGSDAEKEKKWPRRKKISERKKMKVKFFFPKLLFENFERVEFVEADRSPILSTSSTWPKAGYGNFFFVARYFFFKPSISTLFLPAG